MSAPIGPEQLIEAASLLRKHWHPIMADAYTKDLYAEALAMRAGQKERAEPGLEAVCERVLRDTPFEKARRAS